MLLLAAWQMCWACGKLPGLNHAYQAMAQQLEGFHAGPGAQDASRFKIPVLSNIMQHDGETCCWHQPGQTEANVHCHPSQVCMNDAKREACHASEAQGVPLQPNLEKWSTLRINRNYNAPLRNALLQHAAACPSFHLSQQGSQPLEFALSSSCLQPHTSRMSDRASDRTACRLPCDST